MSKLVKPHTTLCVHYTLTQLLRSEHVEGGVTAANGEAGGEERMLEAWEGSAQTGFNISEAWACISHQLSRLPKQSTTNWMP